LEYAVRKGNQLAREMRDRKTYQGLKQTLYADVIEELAKNCSFLQNKRASRL